MKKDSRICEVCGGDGCDCDGDLNDSCPTCGGSGEVPAYWYWDDNTGMLVIPEDGPGVPVKVQGETATLSFGEKKEG